jgi:hypothetical protein
LKLLGYLGFSLMILQGVASQAVDLFLSVVFW